MAGPVPHIQITEQNTETVAHHLVTDFANVTDNTLALKERVTFIHIYQYFKSQSNLQLMALSPTAPVLMTTSPKVLISQYYQAEIM